MNRLFIIGNGFDIGHGLPTKFDPHFKTIAQTVEQIDYYTYEAYKQLISKTKSFYKVPQLKNLTRFLFGKDIKEIIVVGHSCKIDFPYFQFLNEKFPHSRWFFNPFDISTEIAIREMIENIEIKNYIIE